MDKARPEEQRADSRLSPSKSPTSKSSSRSLEERTLRVSLGRSNGGRTGADHVLLDPILPARSCCSILCPSSYANLLPPRPLHSSSLARPHSSRSILAPLGSRQQPPGSRRRPSGPTRPPLRRNPRPPPRTPPSPSSRSDAPDTSTPCWSTTPRRPRSSSSLCPQVSRASSASDLRDAFVTRSVTKGAPYYLFPPNIKCMTDQTNRTQGRGGRCQGCFQEEVNRKSTMRWFRSSLHLGRSGREL